MKRYGILAILVASVLAVFSQESVNSGFGTMKSNRGYTANFSVGQTLTHTYKSAKAALKLGIQQDFSRQKSGVSANTITDVVGNLSEVIPEIDLSEVFVSSDGGELTFEAVSSDPSVAMPVIVNETLSVVQYSDGVAIITVTAIDDKGGKTEVSFETEIVSGFVNPNPCKLSVDATISHVACAGDETGEIELEVSGGVEPYKYVWSNGSTGNGIYSLPAGTYSVVVVDSVACSTVKNFEVRQNDEIQIVESVTEPYCQQNNGAISLNIMGGVAPYTLSWNDGGDAYERSELTSGLYVATVLDAKNCKAEKAISLNDAGSPLISLDKVEPSRCGEDVGSIFVSVRGGKTPYLFVWSDGDRGQNRKQLPKGSYSLVVIDASYCKSVANFEVAGEDFPRPEIALVTVGEESGKNLVVWQKPETELIHHYTVWREGDEVGKYEKLGDVSFNEISIFTDPDANIVERSWRYKLSATDQCGNESPLSKEHKTIHLQQSRGLHGEVNLVWDSYEGVDYASYLIYRQTSAGMEFFKKVPANLNRYTDATPPDDVVGYYVAVQLKDTIDVTKPLKAESGPFVIVLSNIAELENGQNSIATIGAMNDYTISVREKTIVISNLHGQDIAVYDVVGRCLYSTSDVTQAETTVPAIGTYVVKVGDERQNVMVR